MKLPFFSKKAEFVTTPLVPMGEVKSAWWQPLVDVAMEHDFGDGVIYSLKMANNNNATRFFESVAPVNGAVRRLAEAVSGLPIMLVNKTDNTRIEKHPFFDLLAQPNNHFQKTKRDFFRDLVIWKVLEGDAFTVLTGNVNRPPLEMYILDANSTTLSTDGRGYINRVSYHPNSLGSTEYIFDEAKGKFYNQQRTQELLHIANFTTRPENATEGGLSELSPLYYEIQQYVLASIFNASMLKNGGRPSGFLIWDGETSPSEDALMRLREDIRTTYTGAANAGRIPLLSGVKWQEASINPKDGDFRSVKTDAEQQIYKVLGVPMDLSGGGASSVSANNMVNIRREFYQSRVVPMMEDFLEFFNARLLSRYGDANIELRVDRENIDVFTEERAARREIIENSTTMTINEKRQVMGLPPIEHGNKIVDPNGRPIAGPDADGEIGFEGGSSSSQVVSKLPVKEPTDPKVVE